MKLRMLPFGLLVAACAFAAAPTVKPAPWKPKPGARPEAPAKQASPVLINGVPDTGQFLPDTTLLIRVGPRVTRIGDFVTEYMGADPASRPAGDSLGRVAFMTSLIHRDLLGLTARSLNRTLDFTERLVLRQTEERALSDVFFLRYARDPAQVSDAEVAEAQEQSNYEAHFRRILVAERPVAEQVRAALSNRKLTWDDAVKRYSLDRPTAQNPSGDLGWVTRGNFWQGAALELFRLRPGDLSGVLPSDQGYEIYTMLEHRLSKAANPTKMPGVMRTILLNNRIAVLADSIQGLIRNRIGMTFDTTNVRFFCSAIGQSMSVKREGITTHVVISGNVATFADEDTARVLARWKDGGRFSVGQFLAWYTGLSPAVRPNVTFPDGLIAQVNNVVLEPFRASMARELGLDKDREVISRIENKREQILVEHMYQDSVASKVWVTRDERLAYYGKHKQDYVTLPAVDYAMIYRHNRAGADSVVKALTAGANPFDILIADSLQGEVTGRVRHMTNDGTDRYRKLLFEELRPGNSSVVGPDARGGYAVVHLINFDPGRQLSYEESQGAVDEALQDLKSEAILKALLVRLAARFEISSHPELVMRIRLIDPAVR